MEKDTDIDWKLIIIVIIIGAVILSGIYFGKQYYQNFRQQKIESEKRIKEQQDLILEQQKTLEQTKKEIGEMTEAQKAAQIATEKAQREANAAQMIAEEAQKKSQEKYTDLSSIIAQWRPRIAYIECELRYTNGKLYAETAGSGILYKVVIFTNEHVVDNAHTCYAVFPDSNITFTFLQSEEAIRISHYGYDWGMLIMKHPEKIDAYIKNLVYSEFQHCTNKASVGDEVVILGYPTIGSSFDITATRGIISGYDGDYYITDAKIEHGNSGGAAILLKDNCYLGIPTYAIAGEIESLARILDSRIVFDTSK